MRVEEGEEETLKGWRERRRGEEAERSIVERAKMM